MDKWLRNNNVVRIVALCIGILLWVVVHLDVKTNTGTTVPTLRDSTITNVMVQALYDETQYGIVSIEPAEVAVTLRGDDSKLRDINPSNLKIIVDLSKLTAGTYELPLTTDSPLPRGVTIETIPNKVKVVMEERKMKEIPVEINVTGTPEEGFRAGVPIVNPSRVYISAPASKIDAAVVARAEVNVEGANGSVSKKVKLTAYDKSGKEVKGTISPPVLEVEVPITLPLKVVPLQVKWVGQPAPGYAVAGISQSVEEITVYGTQEALDQLDYYEGVQVDLTGLREDKTFSVVIPVPNKSFQIEPSKVDITVNIEPSVVKSIERVPVTVSGLPEGFTANFVNPPSGLLSIALEGAPGSLDKLGAADLKAIVLASNLPPGTYELPVNLSLPQFVKWIDSGIRVQVEIRTNVRGEEAPAVEPSPTPVVQPSEAPSAVPVIEQTPVPEEEAVTSSVGLGR